MLSPASSLRFASSFFALLALASCSVPPKTPQQLMRDATPPTEVAVTGTLSTPGAEVVFGDVAVRVEASRKQGASNLTLATVDDALSLIAAGSNDVRELAVRVREASVAPAVDLGPAVGLGPTVDLGPTVGLGPAAIAALPGAKDAVERVRRQASAVEKGTLKVKAAVEVASGVVELAKVLGAIFGDSNDDTHVTIAADARGVPHRATCLLREQKLVEEHPDLLCTIVRADRPPTTLWHLNVTTSLAGVTDMLSPARGWLRQEPAREGRAPFLLTRPDSAAKWTGRLAHDDYSAFAVDRERTPVARLRVRDAYGPVTAWIPADHGGIDAEARNAVDVALGILALAPWPMHKPDEKKPDEKR